MIARMTFAAMLAAALAASTAPCSGQVYSIATNPQGSLVYPAGAAVAKVANDKLKLQMRVQPMAGSSTYVPLLNSGEIEFGVVNVEETMAAVAGLRAFAGKPNPNLRVLTVLFQIPISYFVPADSAIRSLRDLKGMRLPGGYVGQATVRYLQEALLASVRLPVEDVKQVPVVNAVQGVDAVTAGKADACMMPPGAPQVQQAHVELAARGGIRYIPIDASPEALAILRKYLPMRPLVLQPAPHLVGVMAPTTVMSYSTYLVASDKVPSEIAYRLVQALHESRDDLVKITPILNRFDPKAMTEPVDAPWHPGAVKFYTEVGQWPPKA
jgi:hypothetical protein